MLTYMDCSRTGLSVLFRWLQIFVKPVNRAAQRIKLVFPFLKTMTFRRIENGFDNIVLGFKDIVHFLRVSARHTNVVFTLDGKNGAVAALMLVSGDDAS